MVLMSGGEQAPACGGASGVCDGCRGPAKWHVAGSSLGSVFGSSLGMRGVL